LTYEVRVVNIEVPVRVFDGDRFVDSLKLDDFEVLEDGVPQKSRPFIFSRKQNSKGRKRKPLLSPRHRHFYMFFSFFEFDPRIPKALDNFFITSSSRRSIDGDHAAFCYDMKKSLLENTPPEKIVVH